MLRQPSQSSTTSGPATVISGLITAISGTRSSSSSSRVGARREAGDEQADALVHLRRGEADALILGHRLEHVVDQLLDARRLDLADVDRPRTGTQHRVAHVRNLQNRHRRIIVVGYERRRLSLLPDLRQPARGAHAQGRRSRAHGLRGLRLRPLSRSEGGGGHDHPRRGRAARAGAPGHRTRLRPVGVPRRLRRSRRTDPRRGPA